MAEDRLRRLQRSAAGGDADAVARVLAERVRVGQVEPETVKAWAKAGDHTAGKVVGSIRTLKSLDQLVDLLFPLGRRNLVAAMLPACVLVLNVTDHAPKSQAMVATVRDWLHCPCDKHRAEVAWQLHGFHFVPKKPSLVSQAYECQSRAIWCMARTITTQKSKRIRLLIARRSFHFACRALSLQSGMTAQSAEKLILERITAQMQLS